MSANEQERYEIIQEQIADLLEKAAEDSAGGMVGLAATWLAAEMYIANEQAHERASARPVVNRSDPHE